MVKATRSNKIIPLISTARINDHHREQNMHNSMKFFMVFSQLLGVLPQENIRKGYEEMHFKWRSLSVLYTLIMSILTATSVIFCFLQWFRVGHSNDFETQIFYAGSAVTLILYLRLAKSWSKLMTSWCRMDEMMNVGYGYPETLNKRLRSCFFIFMLVALTEYFLNVSSRYYYLKHEYQDHYKFQIYYEATFPQLFSFVPLTILGAIYCSLLTVHASLMWGYNDLFIILVSMGLALRFKQIRDKLKEHYKKDQSIQFWIGIRDDYNRLTILSKELDDHISYIVLLSYSLNIFFLLIQLYNSLQSVQSTIGRIYSVFVFAYIIAKLVLVSLYAAWINDESLEPAGILNSVPSSSYNLEIKRLLLQINFDNVALTGCKMFRVTRGLILSIAGAVVTYELVLIQFNMATNVQL